MDALERKAGDEYELVEDSVWITVGPMSLRISRKKDIAGDYLHLSAYPLDHEDGDPFWEDGIDLDEGMIAADIGG